MKPRDRSNVPLMRTLKTTLPETNIAGWKIHHFDGYLPGKMVIFMGELLVSGRVLHRTPDSYDGNFPSTLESRLAIFLTRRHDMVSDW